MNEPQSAVEICASAEKRIREAQRLVGDLHPESLDRAMTELAELIGELRGLVKQQARQPELLDMLERVRAMAHLLARQIEHASNLYLGLVQLHLATGYTRQGAPSVASGARNSIEA